MAIDLGTGDILKVALGATEFKKVSLGTDLVWSAASPIVYETAVAAVSSTTNWATTRNLSTTVDLSPYASVPDLALVVGLGWHANGGGAQDPFMLCTYGNISLTQMAIGGDRSAGNNYGAQVWIMLDPPTTGGLTLYSQQRGTANTGREQWMGAALYSNVGGWDSGSGGIYASGAPHSVSVGANEVAVNCQATGQYQSMNSYSQTERTYKQASLLRGRLGDAFGDAGGSKDFSCTGGNYNSAAARLLPAA